MTFLSGWIRADTNTNSQTGIEFPKAIEGYTRDKITPYEVEFGGSGTAIEYQSEDAAITVYVRTGSKAFKTSADFLKDSLAAVKELEARGKYSDVKIFDFKSEKERPGWKSAAFTSSSSNRFVVSFIYCKVSPEHAIKIRATTSDPMNERLQSFVKKIQEVIDKSGKKP